MTDGAREAENAWLRVAVPVGTCDSLGVAELLALSLGDSLCDPLIDSDGVPELVAAPVDVCVGVVVAEADCDRVAHV